jgi:hypothetical protein
MPFFSNLISLALMLSLLNFAKTFSNPSLDIEEDSNTIRSNPERNKK